MRLYSRAAVEPELAHINRRAGPRRLGGVHRPECLVALAHVLDGVEELNRDGRSLRLVEQQLYSGCRHAGRGAAGILDPGHELLHSLGSHIGESDNAYMHVSSPQVGRGLRTCYGSAGVPTRDRQTSADTTVLWLGRMFWSSRKRVMPVLAQQGARSGIDETRSRRGRFCRRWSHQTSEIRSNDQHPG
jgi:hypothetical protein